jgi:hypothetical protein
MAIRTNPERREERKKGEHKRVHIDTDLPITWQ